jgi:myo-inositol-1-phosphate synthase
MKIKRLMINVSFEEQVTVGGLTATLQGQSWIYPDEKNPDIEFIDITDISFMGMEIKGYDAFKKFKSKMSEIGVDVDEILEKKFNELITEEFKEKIEKYSIKG